ncbi:hypothetical protein NY2A_B672L [Paramecium bursaria Chlorella virus NY2A]|uniref:Uncharacterized protein B672L n=1 Tax=Paramecium bursaria Chlorella virus NY2A TaxID=46021 RepID=A7IXJ7_PBCVN|nr:hypothetical protein NY2A_B672L [Paramecium bursaria Chlorella virus NY2A]ABT15071.1 hypothetical protein NY2A_B672L [Paramecium bursaria Chlorella virus NY2A]
MSFENDLDIMLDFDLENLDLSKIDLTDFDLETIFSPKYNVMSPISDTQTSSQDDDDLEKMLMDSLMEDDKLSKKRVDPSDFGVVDISSEIDLTAGGEHLRSDRRNANKKPPKRMCLDEKDRKRFARDMYVDKMTIPTVKTTDGEFVLNLSLISKELARRGTEARGLSTIAVSRSSLSSMISFGYFNAFDKKIDDSAINKIDMIRHLVGHVIPVFGQMRKPPAAGLGPKSSIYRNHSPIIPGEFHPFAFEPVIISTIGDTVGDSGEIVAQGIIVSNKGINFPVGDNRRLTTGRRHEFEESMCWVLITHVYSPYITYASIGPHKTKRVSKDPDVYDIEPTITKNMYDFVFKWDEFMMTHTHLRSCGVSRFGFTDTKQTGKDIARRLFPWSIEYSSDMLDWFRKNEKLNEYLLHTDMTMAGKRATAREDTPSGIDVRRFLLAEILLIGTPLQPMLTNEKVFFDFESPIIQDGGNGLYRKMSTYKFLSM